MDLKKKALLSWCSWFFLGNVFFVCLLALRYLPSISWFNPEYLQGHGRLLLILYVLLSYLGQFALLALLPLLLLLPLILLCPRRSLIFCLSLLVATSIASLIVADAIIYRGYHFHLNGVILDLLLGSINGQFFDFSSFEYYFSAFLILGVFLIECLLAYLAWKNVNKKISATFEKVALVVSLCLYASYSMTIFSAGTPMARILIETARVFPLYTEILGILLPVKGGRERLDNAFELSIIQPEKAASLVKYPLTSLTFASSAHPLNILVIVIDTWRFDMLSKEVTPTLFNFAKKAWVFNRHFSGGNATGPGIFSLFYGMPATYWTAMETAHRSPVLLDALRSKQYQMKILSSAGLVVPAFHKTVFLNVKGLDLKLPGKNPYERDLEVTEKFKAFIAERGQSKQPFFSFLFYDSAHSYCAIDNNLIPYQPVTRICNRIDLENETNPLPYLNRYKNALVLVDQQIKQILELLATKNLLQNTVVIITGDHGEEFNDSHLGYWGHGSNFTNYQLQTPFIVYWPGKKPKTINQLTTHFDVAPFLMTEVLGCQTEPQFYTMGSSIFAKTALPLLVASYINVGVIEEDRITTIFPSGHFQISSLSGELLPEARLNLVDMRKAFQDLRKFYGAGELPERN